MQHIRKLLAEPIDTNAFSERMRSPRVHRKINVSPRAFQDVVWHEIVRAPSSPLNSASPPRSSSKRRLHVHEIRGQPPPAPHAGKLTMPHSTHSPQPVHAQPHSSRTPRSQPVAGGGFVGRPASARFGAHSAPASPRGTVTVSFSPVSPHMASPHTASPRTASPRSPIGLARRAEARRGRQFSPPDSPASSRSPRPTSAATTAAITASTTPLNRSITHTTPSPLTKHGAEQALQVLHADTRALADARARREVGSPSRPQTAVSRVDGANRLPLTTPSTMPSSPSPRATYPSGAYRAPRTLQEDQAAQYVEYRPPTRRPWEEVRRAPIARDAESRTLAELPPALPPRVPANGPWGSQRHSS